MSFENYFIQEAYKKVLDLGDKLPFIEEMVDWEQFRPLVASVFHDNKETGGRPHTDEVLIVKILTLQGMYGLSDPELEFHINDRLSFRNFVGFPDDIPDFSTIWKIRNRLEKAGVDRLIWEGLQEQLLDKGLEIKKGVIQDATFIDADLGRKRHSKEKRAKKNNVSVNYTEKQKRHIDRDGTFSIKHGQVHFGYKNHVKLDVDHHLIRDFEVTTASVHDSQIDLVDVNDIAAYRDKGYFGSPLSASNVIDQTMKRAPKGRKLNGGEQKRNRMISRIRAPGERVFSVMKRVFKGGHTYVKTVERVAVKEMFKCFSYNLYQLWSIERRRLA